MDAARKTALALLVAILAGPVATAWATPPPHYGHMATWGGKFQPPFSQPWGLAYDRHHHIYVADHTNDRIEKYDSHGNVLRSFGHGQLRGPKGIAADGHGHVYVADTFHSRIRKYDAHGSLLETWGHEGQAHGEFARPSGVAVDHHGHVYVADTYNNRIQKFSAHGRFLGSWGGHGHGHGEFFLPMSVAAGAHDRVYVADTFNSRVQVFDGDGNFKWLIGRNELAVRSLESPTGVATDTAGELHVVDENGFVRSYPQGHKAIKAIWGGPANDEPGLDPGEGELTLPQGVAGDGHGHVYVADTYNDRLIKLRAP